MCAGGAKQDDGGLIAQLNALVGSGEPDEIECWPENWQPFKVFEALMTQWNVGMSGVIGLRYEAIPVVMDALGVAKKARGELFEALRIMENEALQVFLDGQ